MLRRFSSMEDLTDLKKASKVRDEEIKQGRLFPYEERILMEHEKDKEEKPAPGMLAFSCYRNCFVLLCFLEWSGQV